MIAYQFTKKQDRKNGVTTIECGTHRAIVYKVGKEWKFIAGFVDPHAVQPSDRYAESGGFRTRDRALFAAESAIVGHGPDGVNRVNVDVEYQTGGKK